MPHHGAGRRYERSRGHGLSASRPQGLRVCMKINVILLKLHISLTHNARVPRAPKNRTRCRAIPSVILPPLQSSLLTAPAASSARRLSSWRLFSLFSYATTNFKSVSFKLRIILAHARAVADRAPAQSAVRRHTDRIRTDQSDCRHDFTAGRSGGEKLDTSSGGLAGERPGPFESSCSSAPAWLCDTTRRARGGSAALHHPPCTTERDATKL